jgi:hypothetical protein
MMVDFARVQNRIYYGYGKAAIRLGTAHAIYRSTDGNNPIKLANFLFNKLISVDQDFKYTNPKKYGDPVWQFLPQDGLLLQNFDYMVSPSGINYFIVDIKPDDRLSPPLCVECNTIISINRPSNLANNTLQPGANTYQEYPLKADQTPIIVDCPVSIIQYTRFEPNTMKLPTSVKLPMYQITIPEFDNIIYKSGDTITDSNGRRFSVISAERTKKSLGFRIYATQEGV